MRMWIGIIVAMLVVGGVSALSTKYYPDGRSMIQQSGMTHSYGNQSLCLIMERNFTYGDGTPYLWRIYGLNWTDPFTNKSICYMPHRGHGKQVPQVQVQQAQTPVTTCHDETQCSDVQTCHNETTCHAEWRCSFEHYHLVCGWKDVCSQHQICSTDNVCHEVNVCVE